MYESVDPETFSQVLSYFNQLCGEQGKFDDNKLKSAIASTDYYSTFEDKIASITRSLIKNHAFVDGNKRSAVMFFRAMMLQAKRKVTMTDQQMIDLFADIAANNYSVLEISKLLFNNVTEHSMRHWVDLVSRD